MDVRVLRATENPERLVCQAARGDYYSGYVGDTDYAELMESVEVKDHHRDRVAEVSRKGSFPKSQEYKEAEAATAAFIQKQLSRGHYGPWEHPQITFAVEGVSRVTMAQITRHRLMSFDVQSMRYVNFSEAGAVTPASLTDPDHFSREDGVTKMSERKRKALKQVYENHVAISLQRYDNLVDAGVPKEDARYLLPLGMKVNMTFSGNARTFLHLLDMRKKANAQWEIRELSEALLDKLFDWMPHTFNYYEEHGPNKLAP